MIVDDDEQPCTGTGAVGPQRDGMALGSADCLYRLDLVLRRPARRAGRSANRGLGISNERERRIHLSIGEVLRLSPWQSPKSTDVRVGERNPNAGENDGSCELHRRDE